MCVCHSPALSWSNSAAANPTAERSPWVASRCSEKVEQKEACYSHPSCRDHWFYLRFLPLTKSSSARIEWNRERPVHMGWLWDNYMLPMWCSCVKRKYGVKQCQERYQLLYKVMIKPHPCGIQQSLLKTDELHWERCRDQGEGKCVF